MKGTISIVGVGRVGLPLALALAEAGFKVYGIDIDREKLKLLEKGTMPFMEKGGAALLEKHTGRRFFPTYEESPLINSDAIILTLGTPVDEHLNPDYSQIHSILPLLKRNIRKGQLIILRSTVSPGTTGFMKDYLEKETGMLSGKDFFIAFCPERIAEGNAIEELRTVPQIIGGADEESSARAKKIFCEISDECLVTDSKSAELAKIFTNMYRYINFAIANEFSIIAMENRRDIHEIVRLVNHNYKRGGLAKPGFSAGPCLYKDGFFLLETTPFNELISASWRINENLPLYLLNKIKENVELKGKKVVILGLAFKKNIDDSRNSLSYKLKKALEREQAKVVLHDPYIDEGKGNLDKALEDAEIIIIAVDHDDYNRLSTGTLTGLAKKGCLICDIWGVLGEKSIIFRI